MSNWKTTLSGVGAAALYAVSGSHDWKHVLTAVLMAVFGVLAKDA